MPNSNTPKRSPSKKFPHWSHRAGGYITNKQYVLEFVDLRIDQALCKIMTDVKGHGHTFQNQEQIDLEMQKVEIKIKKMLKSCGVKHE